MKNKLTLFFIATSFLVFCSSVFAQTGAPTGPTKKPTETRESSQIDKFKEKLASKVAELNRRNQKVVAGTVSAVSKDKLKLKTDTGEFEVKIDKDITKFFEISEGSQEGKELSLIEKGLYIIASGPQADRVINANFLYEDAPFVVDSGRITEVDKNDNSVKVDTLSREKFTLDVETETRQNIINIKTLEIERTGFSKIKEGDNIHFVARRDGRVKGRGPAVRILIIPQEYFIK